MVLLFLTLLAFIQVIIAIVQSAQQENIADIVLNSVLSKRFSKLVLYIFAAMGFVVVMVVLHTYFSRINVTTN